MDVQAGKDSWRKKKITVTPQLQPYLYVTPEQQTVYIKEVGTRTEHKVTYSYFTNLTNIKITLTEGEDGKITYIVGTFDDRNIVEKVSVAVRAAGVADVSHVKIGTKEVTQ